VLQAIDASRFDRSYASRHYTKRTKMKLSSLKTTLLVDATGAIVDLHVTTTRKHDTEIAPSLIKRSSNWIDVLLGDKGYDDQELRELCLEEGHKANNQAIRSSLRNIKNSTKSLKATRRGT